MANCIARCAMGSRAPNNFPNIIPIWPPRLREIIKMAITPSVLVIETYNSTLLPPVYPEVIGGPGPQSISNNIITGVTCSQSTDLQVALGILMHRNKMLISELAKYSICGSYDELRIFGSCARSTQL